MGSTTLIKVTGDGRQGESKKGTPYTQFKGQLPNGESGGFTIWEKFRVTDGMVLEARVAQKDDYKGEARWWVNGPIAVVEGKPESAFDSSDIASVATGLPSLQEAVDFMGSAMDQTGELVCQAFPDASPDAKLRATQALATSLFISAFKDQKVARLATISKADAEKLKAMAIERCDNDVDRAKGVLETILKGFHKERLTELTPGQFSLAQASVATATEDQIPF